MMTSAMAPRGANVAPPKDTMEQRRGFRIFAPILPVAPTKPFTNPNFFENPIFKARNNSRCELSSRNDYLFKPEENSRHKEPMINLQQLDDEHENDDFIVFADDSEDDDETDFKDYSEPSNSSDDDDESGCDEVDFCLFKGKHKKVRFAPRERLCEIHPMIKWSYAYQAARRGPWETIARDRYRFKDKVLRMESDIRYVFDRKHRDKIYRERFKDL